MYRGLKIDKLKKKKNNTFNVKNINISNNYVSDSLKE